MKLQSYSWEKPYISILCYVIKIFPTNKPVHKYLIISSAIFEQKITVYVVEWAGQLNFPVSPRTAGSFLPEQFKHLARIKILIKAYNGIHSRTTVDDGIGADLINHGEKLGIRIREMIPFLFRARERVKETKGGESDFQKPNGLLEK